MENKLCLLPNLTHSFIYCLYSQILQMIQGYFHILALDCHHFCDVIVPL